MAEKSQNWKLRPKNRFDSQVLKEGQSNFSSGSVRANNIVMKNSIYPIIDTIEM